MEKKQQKGFIDFYKEYQKLRTDADPVFAETVALVLLGNAIGKKWINRLQPSQVYHNIFAILVGESTKSRKTTSLEFAKAIYPEEKKLPEEFSPESFIYNLKDKPWSIAFFDEFSMLLKMASNQKSYMARILETLCTFHKYQNPTYTRSLRSGTIIINSPYLSLLGATVPDLLNDVVTKEMVKGGLLARILFVYGKSNIKPRGRTPDVVDLIDKHFKDVIATLCTVSRNADVEFRLTEEALKYFNELELSLLEEYDEVSSFVGRYLEYIVSIADLMKLSDLIYKDTELTTLTNLTNLTTLTDLTKNVEYNIRSLVNGVNIVKTVKTVNSIEQKLVIDVEKEYVERAYNFIIPCLDYAKILQDSVCLSRPVAKLKEFLLKYAPCDHSTAMQRTHLDKREMGIATETLGVNGQDFMFELKTNRAGRGSAKTIYCIIDWINTNHCQGCENKELCDKKWLLLKQYAG